MNYKVYHDLGPNKGAISKIKPFGVNGQVIIKNKKNSISKVGSLEINYKVNQNKYEIDYEANAKGLTSIFYSKPLIQISKGSINTLGLKPDYYLYNHGKKKKSEACWKLHLLLKILRKFEIMTKKLLQIIQKRMKS